jgi:hypothetical protein
VKTVQAEYGAKKMKLILSEILNEQKSNKVGCLKVILLGSLLAKYCLGELRKKRK